MIVKRVMSVVEEKKKKKERKKLNCGCDRSQKLKRNGSWNQGQGLKFLAVPAVVCRRWGGMDSGTGRREKAVVFFA
jgi:hypothetical protein